MKKRIVITLLLFVLAITTFGSCSKKNDTGSQTLTDENDGEELEIVDITEAIGTPQAGLRPDPFDGIERKRTSVVKYTEPDGDKSINVRAFGAVGDGITDDYNSIITACEHAWKEGKVLFFPAGTYYLSRKLVLNKSIAMVGESMDAVTILFKDITADGPIETYNQRGLITFVSDELDIRGITLAYLAESVAKYINKSSSSNGNAEVLFSILKGSDIAFENCRFLVYENNDPSVTCMWAKSEAFDISNIRISACEFINNSESTVGGGLWVSGHDSEKTSVSGIEVSDCYLYKRGNDEAFSVWGYHVADIYVHDNSFVFSNKSVKNEILVAFGMPNNSRKECIKNARFCNNTIEMEGEFGKVIGVQVLTDDSDVEISDNIIMCNPSKSFDVTCFALYSPGRVRINRNSIGIDGGATNSYIVYSSGCVSFNGNYLKTRNCEATMIIRSSTSQYSPNVDVLFENETFDLGATYTNSGKPIIQLSPSGKLAFKNCDVITTSSAIHEIRLQMLYSNDVINYPANSIELYNCNFDTVLYLGLSKKSNTSIGLYDSKVKEILFVTDEKLQCVENLSIINTKYEKLLLNWKKIQPVEMKGQCTKLKTE